MNLGNPRPIEAISSAINDRVIAEIQITVNVLPLRNSAGSRRYQRCQNYNYQGRIEDANLSLYNSSKWNVAEVPIHLRFGIQQILKDHRARIDVTLHPPRCVVASVNK